MYQNAAVLATFLLVYSAIAGRVERRGERRGGTPASHIIGIYLSHECLAGRVLHSHLSLQSHISLIGDIGYRNAFWSLSDFVQPAARL